MKGLFCYIRSMKSKNGHDNYQCNCCNYFTLSVEYVSYEICPVCYWEDDVLSNPDVGGGANELSLNQAKKNYIAFGASRENFIHYIREANLNELKD